MAGIAALGVVLAAWITSATQRDSPSQEDSESFPSAAVELQSFGSAEVDPVPSVRYTFRGRAVGLGPDEYVFIVGQFGDDLAATSGPVSDAGSPFNFSISPPAEFSADGSWLVVWTLPKPPVVTSFSVIVNPALKLADMPAVEPTGSGGGGGVEIYGREEIIRLGPKASSVVASDEVTLSELLPR